MRVLGLALALVLGSWGFLGFGVRKDMVEVPREAMSSYDRRVLDMQIASQQGAQSTTSHLLQPLGTCYGAIVLDMRSPCRRR